MLRAAPKVTPLANEISLRERARLEILELTQQYMAEGKKPKILGYGIRSGFGGIFDHDIASKIDKRNKQNQRKTTESK